MMKNFKNSPSGSKNFYLRISHLPNTTETSRLTANDLPYHRTDL
jgi:hypothetical protein